MAIHSGILAWVNPEDRGAWRGTVHGVAESIMTEQLTLPECLRYGAGAVSAYSLVCPKHLEQYLSHGRCSAYGVG